MSEPDGWPPYDTAVDDFVADLDEDLARCERCGIAAATGALWYGKWRLCTGCKARSVLGGWLPANATETDRRRLAGDVADLKKTDT